MDLIIFLMASLSTSPIIANYVFCLYSSKIFTQILLSRSTERETEYGILPESQCGFRKGSSCLDNLFLINCMINLNLDYSNSDLFVIFVDYKQAFDNVNLLWYKLQVYGISNKIINILKKSL